jgi:hypothetical protein
MDKIGLIAGILPLILYIAGGYYSHQRNKRLK